MIVKCINCDKEYENNLSTGQRGFCSESCMDFWNQNINTRRYTCKVCGKEHVQDKKLNGYYSDSKICPNCKDKTNCEYCGKPFLPLRKNGHRLQIFCSDNCEQKWNTERNTRKIKCKYCGREFIVHRYMNGSYSESVYCSETCVRAQCDKDTQKTSICKYCGKPFIQKKRKFINKEGYVCYENENKFYCSDDCYKKACQTDYNYQAERICSYCGKKFIAEQYTEDDEITKKKPRLIGLYKRRNTCSYECYRKLRGKHYKETCLERYGVTSCAKLDNSKEKTIQTCQERYGVNYGVFTEKAIKANRYGNNSVINTKFADLLDKLGIDYQSEFPLGNYLYDFCIKDFNYLIEVNPSFTHTSIDTSAFSGKDKNYHLEKTSFANESGYRCINIWDWDDAFKIAVSCKKRESLYARRLTLNPITKQTANQFLDEFHYQNSCYGNFVNLGLYQGEQLIQVMTFGKPRYNKNYQWELLRLCTRPDSYVVGGAERLFKHFVREYNPESIISYCDVSKFSGDVYERLGFSLLRQSKPQKIWNKKNSTQYITDNLLRQRGADQLIGTHDGKGTDNEEIMVREGWLPVYDCGQKVFIWLN